MTTFLQACGGVLIAVILILALGKQEKDLAMMLGMANLRSNCGMGAVPKGFSAWETACMSNLSFQKTEILTIIHAFSRIFNSFRE